MTARSCQCKAQGLASDAIVPSPAIRRSSATPRAELDILGEGHSMFVEDAGMPMVGMPASPLSGKMNEIASTIGAAPADVKSSATSSVTSAQAAAQQVTTLATKAAAGDATAKTALVGAQQALSDPLKITWSWAAVAKDPAVTGGSIDDPLKHPYYATFKGIVDSVSIQRDPEIRDRVLAGTFMRFACAHCASSYLVEADILYIDVDRRLFVGVFPRERRGDVTACEALLGATYDAVYVREMPALVRRELGGLECRVVFGYEQLREKIVCFDAGLDDHLVEAVKVALNDVQPKLGVVSLQLVDDMYLWFARIGIDTPPFAVEGRVSIVV